MFRFTIRELVLLTLVVAMVAFVAVSGCSDASTQDIESLQGTWVDQSDPDNSLLVVQGTAFTEHARGRKVKATFKLNASRSPKEIDYTTEAGEVVRGIYELNGDTWTLCLQESSRAERPTRLSPEGRFIVLKRQE
jgi:uncharacterized protein (TIGR03067 family)